MHCTRSRKKSHLIYWYARHLCWIDGGFICLPDIFIVQDLGRKLIGVFNFWGVHLPLVYTCFLYALVFPYIFLLVDCFELSLIGNIEKHRVHSAL